MKKRRVIILALAVVAVLGGWIWWAVATRRPAVPDPVYDGHPLSYWIVLMKKFPDVVPRIDSNAVPYLIEGVKRRDGPLQMAWIKLWGYSPDWFKRRVPEPTSAATMRGMCSLQLHKLGIAARGAIPEVVRVLREDDVGRVRAEAANILGSIANGQDKPVVEALVAAATKDSDPGVRAGAADSLGQIANGHDKPVVEALVVVSKTDAEAFVRILASSALWHLNPEAAAKARVTNPFAGMPRPTTNSAGAGR